MSTDNNHEDEGPMRTVNVRLTERTIADIDALIPRFNLELRLRHFGHRYKRADVLRAVIKRGILAVTADFDGQLPQNPADSD